MEKLLDIGLKIHQNYISEEEEEFLLSVIEQHKWSLELQRKTQQYGYEYNYYNTKISATKDMPGWLSDLRDDVYPEANSCIINHYKPGQGIAPHIDNKSFDEKIVILSLGSPCMFVFTNKLGHIPIEIYLKPRTLLIISGKVRYDWLHSIIARQKDIDPDIGKLVPRGERVSITFRKYNP